ncbi:hypothetical protein GCM10009092_43070 [Bowmanella denitrificans]|uniref:Uncharacterized protein n=1 Tax=Bowmanella denitrificans TaxID=366582 RepID=A0ABN0XVR0_9ALTE
MAVTRAALLLICTFSVQAVPEQCLQDPARTQPCPHLIYKQAQLTDKQGNNTKQLVCVCLSDFADLQAQPSSEAERVRQRMRLKSLAAQLNMDEQTLLELIRY